MTMTQTLEDAVHEAVDAYIAGNPKSFERNESASRSMPGGNTRTVLFHPPFPLAFESGAGARLTSLDGREYVDMLGEYTAGLFGHSDPRILAALHTTLGRGISFGRQRGLLPLGITTRSLADLLQQHFVTRFVVVRHRQRSGVHRPLLDAAVG